MLASLYFYPFLSAFFVSVGTIFVLKMFLKRFSFFKRSDFRNRETRHIHNFAVSRLGGLAIIAGFLTVIFFDSNLVFSHNLWGLVIGSLAVLVFGIWDDFQELNWKIQLFFQIALAVFVYFWGIRTEYVINPLGGIIPLKNVWPGLIFVAGWLILSINSMNWLDGVDGASGGVAFLGALTIFLLILKPEVNQPPMGIISMAFAGAILGFLIFNFHPGKIMAGTSGSMFFGFILGVLAVFSGTKIATALMVMTIPVFDFVWVIGERIKNGVSIFQPDNRHLHHKLMKLGWPQVKITLFFYSITLGIAALSLNTRLTGKLIAISVAVIFMVGFMLIINRKLALAGKL